MVSRETSQITTLAALKRARSQRVFDPGRGCRYPLGV